MPSTLWPVKTRVCCDALMALFPAAWSGLPGVCMEDGQDEFANWKVLQVRGTRLEFVLTNGDGQWDTPDPYGTNQANRNYVIDAPGSYRLLSGKLGKVS